MIVQPATIGSGHRYEVSRLEHFPRRPALRQMTLCRSRQPTATQLAAQLRLKINGTFWQSPFSCRCLIDYRTTPALALSAVSIKRLFLRK